MPGPTLETDRLTGEPLTEDHFGELLRMHQDARVMATLGGLRDEAQTREYLDFNLTHWRRHGFGLWIVRDRTDGAIAGRAVLRHLDLEGVDEVEVGYALYPAWWGRGLATELARRLVTVGFTEHDFPSIVGITQPTNDASRHVLEKAGLRYERDAVHAGSPHAVFRIRRPHAMH
jgi:ribosomal-protein-alanine N-acetyltransferase